MSDAEVASFLDEQDVVTCATLGRDGRPHLMPLWYVVRQSAPHDEGGGGARRCTLWAWTYRKSQKALNVRRDPRATLQVESGGREYGQLRGVMIEADTVLHEDLEVVAGVGAALASRYGGVEVPPDAVMAQAPKRVALEFRETRRVTWDHRKLGGTY